MSEVVDSQPNAYNSSKQTREIDEATVRDNRGSDQQSNDEHGTADLERAVDNRARGKQSKRQRHVATRKDVKKRQRDKTARETAVTPVTVRRARDYDKGQQDGHTHERNKTRQ